MTLAISNARFCDARSKVCITRYIVFLSLGNVNMMSSTDPNKQ